METTVTVVPGFLSLSLRASSRAFSSNGFTTAGTPARLRRFVARSIVTLSESGTCLMQTTIFMRMGRGSCGNGTESYQNSRPRASELERAAGLW